MHLPRRRFFQTWFVLAGSTMIGPIAGGRLLAQNPSRNPVHPPDPSGYEMGSPLAVSRHASESSAKDGRQREAAFRNGLEQLLAAATALRDQLNATPLSEILSVQIYHETQAMERIVKQLKNLAKS